jgi:hypothetical protein
MIDYEKPPHNLPLDQQTLSELMSTYEARFGGETLPTLWKRPAEELTLIEGQLREAIRSGEPLPVERRPLPPPDIEF